MNTEKLKFDNSELDDKALASGTVSRNERGQLTEIVYAIDGLIADDIGAELFVHEFNEVAIYESISAILPNDPLVAIAHNLNAESDGEYTEEHYLLKHYVSSDRTPCIDYQFTEKETNFFRLQADTKSIFVHGAFPEKFI